MLDIRRLRSEPDIVKSAVARRETGGLVDAVDEILALDERRRGALKEANDPKAQRHEVSKHIGRTHRDGGGAAAEGRTEDHAMADEDAPKSDSVD